jgi:hypothetical protein
VIAFIVAPSGPADDAPTMNNWPTRWASSIASNVRWAALRGAGLAGVGRGCGALVDVGGRGLDVVGDGALDVGVGADVDG